MLRWSIIVMLLVGCRWPTDPLEREFRITLRQVENRENPSRRMVDRLLADFDAVQAVDFARARALDTLSREGDWPELYILYSDMHDRLAAIAAYLPLGAPTNYRGGYALEVLASRRETARLGAGDYYLELADAAIDAARSGSKPAARDAYHYLERSLDYVPEGRPEVGPLLAEMADRGTVRVRLSVTGDQQLASLAQDIAYHWKPIREDWYTVDFYDHGQVVDYEAAVQVTDYRTDGPSESTSSTTYSEEVLNYVEKKEYEVRINDSTVVIKVKEIEHFKTITATVTEVRQEFHVTAYGELSVFPSQKGVRVPPLRVYGREEWENEYEVCSGDPDALPPFTCSGFSRSPPNTAYLLEDAMEDLLLVSLRELRFRYAP
ncbi:MAG: hypothetical protein WA952_12345 [Lewinella sp.]